MTTPTARTLDLLRRDGWSAQVVERWLPYTQVRQDLFGLGDVLAIREGEPPLLIQCTSTSNVGSRVRKALAAPALRVWLSCGRFEVWGWAKRGAAGKRKLWTLSRRVLTLADAPSPDVAPTQAERDAGAGGTDH